MTEQYLTFKNEQIQHIYDKIVKNNQICECGFVWTLKDIIKRHQKDEYGHCWFCGNNCGVIISELGDKTFYLGEAFQEIYAKLREIKKIEKIQSKNYTLEKWGEALF